MTGGIDLLWLAILLIVCMVYGMVVVGVVLMNDEESERKGVDDEQRTNR